MGYPNYLEKNGAAEPEVRTCQQRMKAVLLIVVE
jgi:hypothetical protein